MHQWTPQKRAFCCAHTGRSWDAPDSLGFRHAMTFGGHQFKVTHISGTMLSFEKNNDIQLLRFYYFPQKLLNVMEDS